MTQLDSRFYKLILPLQPSNPTVTPNENTAFQQLSQLIDKLSTVCQSLTEENYLSTLLSGKGLEYRDVFISFCDKFNAAVSVLHLVEKNPCNFNEDQLMTDDQADLMDLENKLGATIDSQTFSEKDELKKVYRVVQLRLANYQKTISQITYDRAPDPSKHRKLTLHEVDNQLVEFKEWILPHSDFELQKKIGYGGFADVFLGFQKSKRRFVAVKRLHAQSFTLHSFELFRREICIAAKLHHPAILPFVGICVHSPYFIITEFQSGGSLFKRLHSTTPFDGTKSTICALGIAYGLQYIHQQGLIHRDIKSLNVLLDADDYPKLCDFGMSRRIATDNVMSGGMGTTQWMAPEVLASKTYDVSADIYSYGVVLWELLTREIPYRGMRDIQVVLKVQNENFRPLIPVTCQPKLKKLITRCWDKDPSKRPDLASIIASIENHEVEFPETNWDTVSAYIHLMKKSDEPYTETTFSVDEFKTLLEDLKNPKMASKALGQLRQLKDFGPWRRYLMDESIFKAILKSMETCDNAQLALDIMEDVHRITLDKELMFEFADPRRVTAVFELFKKFGNTGMENAISTVNALITKSTIIFTREYFQKFATFLMINDPIIRINTSHFLKLVIENKKYDDESSLTCLVPNLVSDRNIMPEQMEELLIAFLNLIDALLDLQKPAAFMIECEAPERMVNLAVTPPPIAGHALDILLRMVQQTIPLKRTIATFVSSFYSIIKRCEPEIATKMLYVLLVLLKDSHSFSEIHKNGHSFEEGIRMCINRNTTMQALTLKALFALINSSVTQTQYFVLVDEFAFDFLQHDNATIQQLAAAVIIIYIQWKRNTDPQRIEPFLRLSLAGGSPRELDGLRLAGMLATSFQGALFLERSGLMQSIINLIDGPMNRTIVLKVLAAFSSTLPISTICFDAAPAVLQYLDDPSEYPLIFAGNIAMSSRGSQACIGYIHKIVKILQSPNAPKTTTRRAMETIKRLIESNPPKDSSIDELVTVTNELWPSDYKEQALAILECTITTEKGRAALSKCGIVQKIIDDVSNMENGTPLRYRYMKILGMLQVTF